MSDWPLVRLDDVAEKIGMGPFGSSIKVSTFVDQGIPVIIGKHLHASRLDDTDFNYVTEEHAQRLANSNVYRGDVVLTHRGNIGQVAYIPHDSQFDRYVVSQSQFYLRPDIRRLLPEYLTYYFHSAVGRRQLLANTSSTGVPSIAQPVTYLRDLVVPLPSIQEQRAINEVLGSLDDKIEANRRQHALQHDLADTLFRSWFVEPNRNPSWGVRPFGDLIEDTIGGDWGKESPDETFSTAVSIIRGTDIPDLGRNLPTRTPTRFIKPQSLEKRRLRPGDLIVEVSGGSPKSPTGRSLFVTESLLNRFGTPAICASFCRRFRPKTFEYGVLAAAHLNHLYRRGGTWKYQYQSTGIANFQTKDFLLREMVLEPGAAIIESFSAMWTPFMECSNESSTLEHIRDFLLPRLLSGELRVRNAMQLVEETV